MDNISFLELKYGNIYGGYPNFFAIAEVALLVFEPRTNRIFLNTWINNADVDYVSVVSETNELGHTIGKKREVINMRSGERRPFDEEFSLNEDQLQSSFKKLRGAKRFIKTFLLNNMRKYKVRDLVTFDGRRDIFLCEGQGVNFSRINIFDLQKELNKETKYLFSLNKLSVVCNFRLEGTYLRSNNLEYWLHPIAAKQIDYGNAAYDAARLLMIFNENKEHHDDFMMKAALLLNKIEISGK